MRPPATHIGALGRCQPGRGQSRAASRRASRQPVDLFGETGHVELSTGGVIRRVRLLGMAGFDLWRSATSGAR